MKYEEIKDGQEYPVGNICAYYGGIVLKKVGKEHFWAIENWDGCDFEIVSERVFKALIEEEGY